MDNLLTQWLATARPKLEQQGFKLKFTEGPGPGSCSVDIDSSYVVGGICFWPGNIFEFGFNDCESGKEVLLETMTLDSVEKLDNHFDSLLRTTLLPK